MLKEMESYIFLNINHGYGSNENQKNIQKNRYNEVCRSMGAI